VDLRQHFARESAAAAQKRHERLARLGKIADRLSEELDGLNERDRWTLAGQIGVAEGQGITEVIFNKKNKEQLDDVRNFIVTLAAAAKRPLWKPGRGQPRNISAYLVMMDIASIFEWLSTTEPTRQVDRKTHDESGPFREFAGAIWPFVFGSSYGFLAAMKNWASARGRFGEKSAIIANIAMRHPEWGLFAPF
jgi:hypothetical protein